MAGIKMDSPNMANEEEIFNRLSEVENETQSIKTTIEHHGKLLTDYGTRQKEHGNKLDDIITAVTRQAARAEANPKTEWIKVIPVLVTTVAALVSMFAIIMGGLVYLIIILTSKDAEINRKLIENQSIIIRKDDRYNSLRHEYADRELLILRKRVNALENQQKGLRSYRRSRGDLSVRISGPGYGW